MPIFLVQNIIFLGYCVQPHIILIITKFLQQNIELGHQVCTGTVSEQHLSELLSSSLVECPLLTLKFPGSNPRTGKKKEIL